MFRRTIILILLVIAGTCISKGHAPGQVTGEDPEQQQLEWCFMYSNILGFNIEYISNPRLYQNVTEWMGTPYKYAGESRKGTDCSGFVCQMIRNSYGEILTGSAKEIYARVKPINKENLKEGDLVFFKIRKSRISHVGIYLSQNRFIHASVGLGVTISNLDDPYYAKYFFRGGRLAK
ncbi:MAG: C40 family peptidase [Bacteroidia bacterium]|nr:C40 family peptidase [Bacteroidia bacterium]